MDSLETRRIILRPISEKDLIILHKWRNDPIFLKLCSRRRNFVNYEEFITELKQDFDNDRHVQFIAELKRKNLSIGTIYSYNLNLIDGYIFITVYFEKDYWNKGYGIESVALFLQYLFDILPLHKVYIEVYDYNNSAISIIQKTPFIKEGCFKEHRFFEGKRWDLIRFAFYRHSLKIITDFLQRLAKNLGKKGGGKNGLV